MRHEAVAERAFEEMERALSEFLAREEARPFEHYAYASPATGERSPLASGLEPFVVGAFQIDPEGAVTTPLDPADVAARRVRAAVQRLWPRAMDGRRARAERLSESRLGIGAGARAKRSRERQAPGTTRALAGPGVDDARGARGARSARARARREVGAFDALESLNRAADDRAERKQKVAQRGAVGGVRRRSAASRSTPSAAAAPAARRRKPLADAAPAARPRSARRARGAAHRVRSDGGRRRGRCARALPHGAGRPARLPPGARARPRRARATGSTSA